MPAPGLKVTTPTDLTIELSRRFRAPRELVWEAMTRPELLQRWMFMPPGWSWAACEMDLRVGGRYRWAWNGPDGRLAMTISGVHKEVVPPARIVHTEWMEMGPGAGECGPEDSPPWELDARIELEESGGETQLKMTLVFPTREGRDMALASGMERGVSAGYDTLDVLFADPASWKSAKR